MKISAIIPARGGSKGIPGKNLIVFCGKPLIYWSIKQALLAEHIDSVWVSSDCEEILEVALWCGAQVIKRPDDISGDTASSEAAWLHAVDYIESVQGSQEYCVGMQATSPLRECKDIDLAIRSMQSNSFDSLLSVCVIEDFFIWERQDDSRLMPINYDLNDRKRRQLINTRYLENGSFYIFKPEILRENNNRLGGIIGIQIMEKFKMFQIDNMEDIELCEAIMKAYNLNSV